MNEYTDHHSVRYQTPQDTYRLAKPWYYCAKLDLQSEYRSWRLQSMALWKRGHGHAPVWCSVTIRFGLRGPSHFSRLSNAIRRMMYRKGYKGVVSYTDDFVLACETYEECKEALLCLINLVRKLGLRVSWEKVVSPTKHVTFLGVDIDTNDCVLSFGADKLNMLHDKLKAFKHWQRATKVQLQSLAGSLNWACQVVRWGRFFLRRILASRLWGRQNTKRNWTQNFARTWHGS